MAFNLFQLKRWIKMLSGKSVEHVNQDIGKSFTSDSIRGYYNNLTQKVLFEPQILNNDELPFLITEKKEKIFFPVAIFQYGLGAYDLWLQTNDERYIRKFEQCVDWTLKHQDSHGRWDNFSFVYPDAPYGAMAQGEASSLLVRAYIYTGNQIYIDAAKKAIDFMLIPLNDGGTTYISDGRHLLMEYTHLGMVLNGAIFAWWGLYDLVLSLNDTGKYKRALDDTLKSLIDTLPAFRSGYWSNYSLDNQLASPFYHNLHIAQMQAMYQLTGEKIFDNYARLWAKRQKNPICKTFAFIKKATQKILE